MRSGIKILLFSLLFGVMMATGLTDTDATSCNPESYDCLTDLCQDECYEEYLHDANDNSHPHLSNRRRSSSSSNPTLKKSQRRSFQSKELHSFIACTMTLDDRKGASYLENCGWRPFISHRGSIVLIRLHQFRI